MVSDQPPSTHASEIIGTYPTCTVEELCVACKVDKAWVAQLVDHGVIDPIARHDAGWRFAGWTVVRVAQAKRLERDLNLNAPGIALALQLMDEIKELRAQLNAFARQR